MREAHGDMVSAAGSRAARIAPGAVPGLEDPMDASWGRCEGEGP